MGRAGVMALTQEKALSAKSNVPFPPPTQLWLALDRGQGQIVCRHGTIRVAGAAYTQGGLQEVRSSLVTSDPRCDGPLCRLSLLPPHTHPRAALSLALIASSDFWALGCIIYQLLSGKVCF